MKEENYDIILSFEKRNWWYRAKRDLFLMMLKDLNSKFESSLDMGCGVGSNFEILKKYSKKVIGIDNSKKAIEYCKDKGYEKLYVMDATNLKFSDKIFDLVICSDVLEHLDDKKTVAEVSRILKKKGIFIFSVPAHRYLWGPTDEISNHKRRYEKKEVEDLLRKDFDILYLRYWNLTMFFPDLIFIKLLNLFNKKYEKKNALEFIPSFFNDILYSLLRIENRFLIKFNNFQGVSIVGIARKKNGK